MSENLDSVASELAEGVGWAVVDAVLEGRTELLDSRIEDLGRTPLHLAPWQAKVLEAWFVALCTSDEETQQKSLSELQAASTLGIIDIDTARAIALVHDLWTYKALE
jgi:hypothetical protein